MYSSSNIMNWILIAVIVLLAEKDTNHIKLIFGLASPLPLAAHTRSINPYILHWEAANFDRITLEKAHQHHLEQKKRRRKRDLTNDEYGPVHTIKLKFSAHDREFKLVLHQDPLSVFMSDAEIENSLGPVDYDISRIYTGSLEDDENSYVNAVLTTDNLIDGTISTNTEQYYMEPSNRYSEELEGNLGIHTIVYKLSDVKMENPVIEKRWLDISTTSHCESEKLRKKLVTRNDIKRQRKAKITKTDPKTDINSDGKNNIISSINKVLIKSASSKIKIKKDANLGKAPDFEINTKNLNSYNSISHLRSKRWMPSDEMSNIRDPPLPLDLNTPYNNNYSNLVRHNNETNFNSKYSRPAVSNINLPASNKRNVIMQNIDDVAMFTGSEMNMKIARNRNILSNEYNPNSNTDNKNSVMSFNLTSSNNTNFYNNKRNNMGYNNNSGNTKFRHFLHTNLNSAITNSSSDNGSRANHKTHVEIITKNGATKKPNIIVNNYNPDVVQTIQNNNFNNNNINSHIILNVRNDLSDITNTSHSSSSSARTLYDRKSTCMLYLQADHTFFQKMGSDEASIEAITRHVQRANSIYKNTDFNGDGKPDNITFMIKRIKVHNSNAVKDPGYRFPGNYGVEKFLELFSEEDYDAFCLAYMFTYRDFEMGTLGLAWTGDLKNAGGVCEKNGHYRGSLKSLNTGIVTLLNYGKHVPPAVSHVTLAHEIGHNFGSPHDPEQCTPGGEDGNYIMFARATSGDKRNNNKFSPCSLKSIEPVLNAKARSAKGCFTEPQTSICGNGVVEPGEQCDCGWEEDCKDDCCFPMSRHPRNDEKPCTLLPRAICSPSQGPCCTNQCILKFGDKCREDNGCRDPSYCDGRMPQCPPSVNKPNKTICNKEFVCYMGECTGSICLAYGLESCQCLPGPSDPKTKSCELCCKEPGEGKHCKSSFEWNEPPFDVPDMFAKPGTPCNDYNGYCDVFQKCREVDPSGPLATLRKLLLSEESIATFKKWIQSNWYTVVLAAVGVIIILVLSTKLLGKKNMKLKSVTIIHSATTETVRLPEDNTGVIVHTAVRTKVPFKKKVRGQRSSKTAKVIIKQNTLKNSSVTISNNPNITETNSGGIKMPTRNSIKTSASEGFKKLSRKKNGVAAGVVTDKVVHGVTANNVSDVKIMKKNKKHKEVIDYSKSSGSIVARSSNHTNTFGKVQKWLLDSPIVSQPLSQFEHSSKVRKIMSKSQSTPERLVQKSPQKTKSVGNLSNEKVKLQVVYKPPFKFSLKLSKNATVKTHVIGGGLNKSKRKPRSTGDKKRSAAVSPLPTGTTSNGKLFSIGADRGRRTAIFLRNHTNDEKQEINLVESYEPTYETLNPKSAEKNSLYENTRNSVGLKTSIPENTTEDSKHNIMKSFDGQQSTRGAINSNFDGNDYHCNTVSTKNYQFCNHSQTVKHDINNQTFFKCTACNSNLRKSGDNLTNLNLGFGSTQNLLQCNPGFSSKTKKRNSLNLKSSVNANVDKRKSEFITKRSNSNINLKRENSSSNLRPEALITKNLPKSSSIDRVCNSSNIPRASLLLSNNNLTLTSPNLMISRQHTASNLLNTNNLRNNSNGNTNRLNHIVDSDVNDVGILPEHPNIPAEHSTASTNVPITKDAIFSPMFMKTTAKNTQSSSSNDCKNINGSKKITSHEDFLPSDLEVMVSDVENLVS